MFMESYGIHNSSYSQQTQRTATSGVRLSNEEEEEHRERERMGVRTLSNSASI
jgi:hypothetical protein